jgi:hypothetical protein
MMRKNSTTGSRRDHTGAAPAKIPAARSTKQVRATTAAKDARINEAGLGGKRTGKVSARVKRAQGRRDTKAETIPPPIAPSRASADDPRPEKRPLQVQVNTARNVKGSHGMNLYVQSTVEASLDRFAERITRVEIHLSDDNGSKSKGDDKRCILEARPAGLQPVVVTHIGATIDEAVDGALQKMEKLLENTFAKLHQTKGGVSLGDVPTD